MKNTLPKENKSIKTSKNIIKKTEKNMKETSKASKKIMEQGKKLAIEGTKTTIKTAKHISKTIISGIKALIAGIKSLIGMLAAGGFISVIAVVIICLIGLLVSSVYGIFFSSEDIGNKITMSDCIAELNTEMDNKIKEIERTNPHEEVIIESNKAEWKDVLVIYSVIISGGNNKQEVITINEQKKEILKKVFWDMNSISSNVVREVYNEDNSIDYIGQRKDNKEKDVLHIKINSKSIEEMKNQYNFNNNQLKQLSELTNSKNQQLWNYTIYGTYGSRGIAEYWKQRGESWSNIKIGNTNKTIGDIGCLVTSISILIKKSGVSTNGIAPFNPGTFVQALNNVYGFNNNGALQYGPISRLIPNFKYVGRITLSGKSKKEKFNIIKSYFESGYYIAIKVIDNNNSQHWVALDNIKNNTIIMADPGSNSRDMWKEYNWKETTQFVYFASKK